MISLARTLLLVFGCTVIGIGASFVIAGSGRTAELFGRFYNLTTNGNALPTGFDNRDVDNEFRFYSVFWIAYGLMLIKAAIEFPASHRLVFLLMGVFFLGGLFRVFSIWQLGWPHGLFQFLMWLELTIPIVFCVLTSWSLNR